MKYNLMFRCIGAMLNGLTKNQVADSGVRKEITKTYREIILRAGDIGSKNRLLTSYGLAAYFIAMNRVDGLTPQENLDILESNMRNSKCLKIFMGNSKHYFNEKNMASRRAWSRETHLKKYKNDWVVDVLEKTDDYEFGFDYLECGVCKLCWDEGCFELAQYLCRLDFMLVELIGIRLERTTTLAEGGEKCDIRFLRS